MRQRHGNAETGKRGDALGTLRIAIPRFRDSAIPDQGFAVIEVLVSLSLVALLFTVLIVAVSAGMAKVREADEDTPIVAWVASAMEAAIALGVDGLPRSGSYDALSLLSAAPVLPRGVGRGILTVRQLSVKPLLKEVSVAAMRARTGQSAFTLTTIVGARSAASP